MPRSNYNEKEAEQTAERQFREGLSRVGTTLGKNLLWFINFSQLPLHALTVEQKLQLWHDLVAIMVLASRSPDLPGGRPLSSGESSFWQYLEACLGRNAIETGNSDYQSWWHWIGELHLQIEELIYNVVEHQGTSLQLSHVRLDIGSHGLVPMFPLDMFTETNRDAASLIRGGDAPILVRLALAIHAYQNKVHRCPACENIFVALRSDQAFCTSNCRSRFGMKRWRAKQSSVRARTTEVAVQSLKSIIRTSKKGK